MHSINITFTLLSPICHAQLSSSSLSFTSLRVTLAAHVGEEEVGPLGRTGYLACYLGEGEGEGIEGAHIAIIPFQLVSY